MSNIVEFNPGSQGLPVDVGLLPAPMDRLGPRFCAACGAAAGRTQLLPGDDDGYILFCVDCLAVPDPRDPYFEVGGPG